MSRHFPALAPTDRLPLQPLLDALPIDHTLARPDVRGPGASAQAARQLGVSTRTLHRLRLTGLDLWAADRLAIAAGLHPLTVWREGWIDALADADAQPTSA
jgi:hypothetical protein